MIPVLFSLALAVSQAASVTQADIQRLQDSIYQAGSDVSQLRSRDAGRASRLQAELDELREEVIYLKVKLRKENTLARAEYADVRDRIDDLRSRARGDAAPAYSTPPPPTPAPVAVQPVPAPRTSPSASGTEVPAGTELDVRLLNSLNSGTTQVEDRFEASTLADLSIDGRTVVPAGSILRGVVSAVQPATRTNRTARMTISFDQITVDGRSYPIRATVTQALQGEGIKGEVGRVGVGAGVGAILGGILGGFKGALAGILIGGGGTIAATEGKEIELPQGTVLRLRFDSPVTLAR